MKGQLYMYQEGGGTCISSWIAFNRGSFQDKAMYTHTFIPLPHTQMEICLNTHIWGVLKLTHCKPTRSGREKPHIQGLLLLQGK